MRRSNWGWSDKEGTGDPMERVEAKQVAGKGGESCGQTEGRHPKLQMLTAASQ